MVHLGNVDDAKPRGGLFVPIYSSSLFVRPTLDLIPYACRFSSHSFSSFLFLWYFIESNEFYFSATIEQRVWTFQIKGFVILKSRRCRKLSADVQSQSVRNRGLDLHLAAKTDASPIHASPSSRPSLSSLPFLRLPQTIVMADIYRKPGFDFSNVIRYVRVLVRSFPTTWALWIILTYSYRNNHLASKGVHLPKATSTGTTIVGCLFKDGIVLGADTRATEGPIVADKNCEKVSPSRTLIM